MATTKRKIIRTPDEAWQAGWDAADDAPPLTEEQVIWVGRLMGRDRPEADGAHLSACQAEHLCGRLTCGAPLRSH